MINRDSSMKFFEYVRKYLTEFMPRHRNLSENTILANRDSLNLLFDYSIEQLEIPLVKIDVYTFQDIGVITGFLNWLEEERNCGNSTINQRLSCIRSFFKYIAYEDVTYASPRMKDVIDNKITPYVFVNGKGRKKRTVPLMQKTMDIYRIYVKEFHNSYNSNDYLFYVIHHGQKIKSQMIMFLSS